MHIFNSLQGLCEKPEGLRFSKNGFGVLMVEEVAVVGIIHDHIDGVILEKSVPQFDDMWVIDESMDGDFPLKQFHLSL